jgi:hypothetical protein
MRILAKDTHPRSIQATGFGGMRSVILACNLSDGYGNSKFGLGEH